MKTPTQLMIALDYSDPVAARHLVSRFTAGSVIWKIGSELFLAAGPEFVKEMTRARQRIFLDLKFNDIPNTVANAATQAALMGVEFFTLHISGGRKMIEAVKYKLSMVRIARPKLLGVSVLTSFDPTGWNEVTQAVAGKSQPLEKSVIALAQAGVKWGLDGLVCSPHELGLVKKAIPQLFTVVPGIRTAGLAGDDQARVMTPAEARAAGANAIVVGRPITQAPDPVVAVNQILKDLSS